MISEKKIKAFKEIINNTNNKYNFIISQIDYKQSRTKTKLDYCYLIKDNICMKNTITTGGSRMLSNFKSAYDATVVSLLNKSGCVPLAKANMDEFGMGGTGLLSAYGYVTNPYDSKRISSGSSSGSAVGVAVGACDFALATDTGDSARMPATFTNTIGYKPSYGLISRYGVFPYAPSLDCVGIIANDISVIKNVMNVISKKDPKDATSRKTKINFLKSRTKKSYKVVILQDTYDHVDSRIIDLYDQTISKLDFINIKRLEFSKELLNLVPNVYRIISYSEANSCYQNIQGITFGNKADGNDYNEIVLNTRTKYFGDEVKRRFVIGSYFTTVDNYEEMYVKATKYRTLINQRINEILNECDFVISFAASCLPPLIEDVLNNKIKHQNAEFFLQVANLAGLPSISIPIGFINGLPTGINITSKVDNDANLLLFAQKILDKINGGK